MLKALNITGTDYTDPLFAIAVNACAAAASTSTVEFSFLTVLNCSFCNNVLNIILKRFIFHKNLK